MFIDIIKKVKDVDNSVKNIHTFVKKKKTLDKYFNFIYNYLRIIMFLLICRIKSILAC